MYWIQSNQQYHWAFNLEHGLRSFRAPALQSRLRALRGQPLRVRLLLTLRLPASCRQSRFRPWPRCVLAGTQDSRRASKFRPIKAVLAALQEFI